MFYRKVRLHCSNGLSFGLQGSPATQLLDTELQSSYRLEACISCVSLFQYLGIQPSGRSCLSSVSHMACPPQLPTGWHIPRTRQVPPCVRRSSPSAKHMEEDGRPWISKRLQVLPLAMRLSLLHSTRPSPALGQPFLTFGDLAAHTKTCKTLFFFSLLHTSIPASRSLRSSSPTLSLPLVALKKQPYRCTCRANTPAHCAGLQRLLAP